jgi:hypothetical protein
VRGLLHASGSGRRRAASRSRQGRRVATRIVRHNGQCLRRTREGSGVVEGRRMPYKAFVLVKVEVEVVRKKEERQEGGVVASLYSQI